MHNHVQPCTHSNDSEKRTIVMLCVKYSSPFVPSRLFYMDQILTYVMRQTLMKFTALFNGTLLLHVWSGSPTTENVKFVVQVDYNNSTYL